MEGELVVKYFVDKLKTDALEANQARTLANIVATLKKGGDIQDLVQEYSKESGEPVMFLLIRETMQKYQLKYIEKLDIPTDIPTNDEIRTLILNDPDLAKVNEAYSLFLSYVNEDNIYETLTKQIEKTDINPNYLSMLEYNSSAIKIKNILCLIISAQLNYISGLLSIDGIKDRLDIIKEVMNLIQIKQIPFVKTDTDDTQKWGIFKNQYNEITKTESVDTATNSYIQLKGKIDKLLAAIKVQMQTLHRAGK